MIVENMERYLMYMFCYYYYTRRYILDHYRTKSLRCKGCVYNEGCDGLHINHVRAHGYGAMQPVTYDE